MATKTKFGHIFKASGAWHTRFYLTIKGKRVQKSSRICAVDELHPSKESVIDLATVVVKQAQELESNRELCRTTGNCPTCGRFIKAKPIAELSTQL